MVFDRARPGKKTVHERQSHAEDVVQELEDPPEEKNRHPPWARR